MYKKGAFIEKCFKKGGARAGCAPLNPPLWSTAVSGQLPRRTIPHRTGFGPDEWFYSVVVVLVGSCPGGE